MADIKLTSMREITRVSMNLNYKALANVEDLCDLLNESNKTSVVSTALNVALEIIKIQKSGIKIILEDKKGNRESLKFIL